MPEMLNFCTQLLQRVADFLLMPPIIYLVGMVLCVCVFKIIFGFISSATH